MRGHQKLIELRMKRVRPAVVFLNDYPTDPSIAADVFDGSVVEIAGEALEGLDLRFLAGLRVSAGASTESRAKAILEACKRAGAAMVACCHIPTVRAEQKTSDYIEIWSNQK
jgi:hypothetical protein